MRSLSPNNSTYCCPLDREALLQLSSMAHLTSGRNYKPPIRNAGDCVISCQYNVEFQAVIYLANQHPYLAGKNIGLYNPFSPFQRLQLQPNNCLQYPFNEQTYILVVPKKIKEKAAKQSIRRHSSAQGQFLIQLYIDRTIQFLTMSDKHAVACNLI